MSDKEKQPNSAPKGAEKEVVAEKPTVSFKNNTNQKQIIELKKHVVTLLPGETAKLEGSYEYYFKQVAHLIKNNVIKLK